MPKWYLKRESGTKNYLLIREGDEEYKRRYPESEGMWVATIRAPYSKIYAELICELLNQYEERCGRYK